MKARRVLTTKLLICGWCVVFALSGCNQIITSPEQPIYQITTTHPAIPNKLPVTNTLQPDQTAEVSPLALPDQISKMTDWGTFTHVTGVTVRFPNNWQLKTHINEAHHLSIRLWPNRIDGVLWAVGFVIESLPDQEKSTLYRFAGDTIDNGEGFSPTQIVWDKQLILNEIKWNLHIEGETKSVFRGYSLDGIEFLADKGAITEGSIVAIHYEKGQEFYIAVSRNLDRDMIIALDRYGGDAVLADYLQVFTEILSSITITH